MLLLLLLLVVVVVVVVVVGAAAVVVVVVIVWIALTLHFLRPNVPKMCPNVTSCTLMFILVALMLLFEVTLGQTLHFSCALILPCCLAINFYN